MAGPAKYKNQAPINRLKLYARAVTESEKTGKTSSQTWTKHKASAQNLGNGPTEHTTAALEQSTVNKAIGKGMGRGTSLYL